MSGTHQGKDTSILLPAWQWIAWVIVHPKWCRPFAKQAGQLLHVSNWFHIEPQAQLAAEITRLSFGSKVFFCNSGTEATEGAIKIARKFFIDQGQKNKTEIITTYKAFHGRTLGAMSATPQDKIQKGFGPLVPGFKYVPFNDIAAMKKAITSKTCAVMVEPISRRKRCQHSRQKISQGITETVH